MGERLILIFLQLVKSKEVLCLQWTLAFCCSKAVKVVVAHHSFYTITVYYPVDILQAARKVISVRIYLWMMMSKRYIHGSTVYIKVG